MNIVDVQHIGKTFGTGHAAVTAVDDVSLQIESGDILLVMGPSGSGKTTVLSMIGTLMRASTGSIIVKGKNLNDMNAQQLASLRLLTFGFIFQSFNLLSALTAIENVMIPALSAGMPKKPARIRAAQLLDRLHLGERLNSLPKNLSGGEKQRVAIARALMNDPELILADEPTANLDSKTGFEVTRLLCQIACEEHKAVIIVSHDQRLQSVAKRILTIEDGKLIREEPGGHNANCPHQHT